MIPNRAWKTDGVSLFPGFAVLEKLGAVPRSAFDEAIVARKTLSARDELVKEGEKLLNPLLVLDGWAARVSYLSEGRRQILAFVLPGEFIGTPVGTAWTATSSVAAITRVSVCQAPQGGTSRALDELYAASRLQEERSLLAQIVRLSQMSAYDRIGDLLLNLWERLKLARCTREGSFHCPLTQDMLADAVGLTPVHVNRTLQALRKDQLITWRGRQVRIDPDRLATRLRR